MLRNEQVNFFRDVSIKNLHKYGEREQRSNIQEEAVNTKQYYPTQRPLNRFEIPKLPVSPSPYIQAQGLPMPRMTTASTRLTM